MDNEQKSQEVSLPESAKNEKTTSVEKSSLQQWPANSRECQCLQLFGDREAFMIYFNPDRQVEYCQPFWLERIFCGSAPEFVLVWRVYGRGCLESWLMIQLDDLNSYLAPQDRMSTRQIEQAAGVIANQFFYLKVTEFMLFMQRLKAGFYGHFYGRPDLLRLTSALQEFLKYRENVVKAIEREKRRP